MSVPSSFQDDAFHPLYSGQSYAPVMDLTEPHFRDVFQFYRGASDAIPADWYAPGFGPPANQNAPRGAARSFHAGRREVFKGSLAMGFCDAVRFPCGYVTVLRDPMERLFSHHAYWSAAGAENRAGWTRRCAPPARDLTPRRTGEGGRRGRGCAAAGTAREPREPVRAGAGEGEPGGTVRVFQLKNAC